MAAAAQKEIFTIFHDFKNERAEIQGYKDGEEIVIIMQGVPGSGKSTLAKAIRKRYGFENVAIVSADNHFTNPYNGEYNYNPYHISTAHEECKSQFKKNITIFRKNILIVDNTNVRVPDYKYYTDLGKQNGYKVIICNPMHKGQSIHDVPEFKIIAMRGSLEQSLQDTSLPRALVKNSIFNPREESADPTQTLAPSS